jgi:hypothetical protein
VVEKTDLGDSVCYYLRVLGKADTAIAFVSKCTSATTGFFSCFVCSYDRTDLQMYGSLHNNCVQKVTIFISTQPQCGAMPQNNPS